MTQVLTVKPQVPVREEWEWLTDILVSNDGSEQRIALRGSVPRVTQKAKYAFASQAELRAFYSRLVSSLNRFWMPEWQFATRTTAETLSGASRLYFDHDLTDIRDDEHVIVGTLIHQVTTIHSDGATVTPSLSATLPEGSIIAPAGLVVIEDDSNIVRLAVNEVGESTLGGTYNARTRDELPRPGTTSTLTLWSGVPVLDVRPIADDTLEDRATFNQIVVDNKINNIDLIENWDYSRISGNRQYKLQRTAITEPCAPDTLRDLDYWRHFLAYCKGAQRKFWLPTYRPDLLWVSGSVGTMTVSGTEYAEMVFPYLPTHKKLQITYENGTIHRCTVTSASVSGGNSFLAISPARPSGTIAEISFLLAARLGADTVEFEHYGLHSMLKLSVRTCE